MPINDAASVRIILFSLRFLVFRAISSSVNAISPSTYAIQNANGITKNDSFVIIGAYSPIQSRGTATRRKTVGM